MGYVSPSLFCDHSALGEHLENTDKATTAFTTDKIAFFIELDPFTNAALLF